MSVSEPAFHQQNSALIAGGGEMGALMRRLDWSRTPVGPAAQWPQSLRTAVSILLNSGFPMYIAWGPEFIQFYNDAYRPILGSTKHPAALGQGSRECFAEIWGIIGPMFQRVLDEGESTTLTDQLLPLNRHNFIEECYFTFSYSAVRDESSRPGGVLVTCIETTEKVIGERQLRTLRELAAHSGEARDIESACRQAMDALGANRKDIPFSLLYLIESPGAATLLGTTGVGKELPISPREIPLAAAGEPSWPLTAVLESGRPSAPIALAGLFGDVDGEAWPEPVQHAVILPLTGSGQRQPVGFLIAGISPRRAFDENYSSFFQLAASQTATVLASARAYSEERKRAEALAELDRAKTAFFSNVSHEFRTPLTLMLGPLEDALAAGNLPEAVKENISVARRNSLRLLKLVNTLLDFTRIEAGRVRASYEELNLSQLTAELASTFRSAVEGAGMRLVVETPAPPCIAYVDFEMWEKIVLNLISNAFKYTRKGEIVVSVKTAGDHVELQVADTGIGIPADELPRIFDRFHRVEGARGRTLEGTGIGLALVAELVKIHAGTVTVESEIDRGTTFTVRIPRVSAEVAARSPGPAENRPASVLTREVHGEPAAEFEGVPPVTRDPAIPAEGRVLIADDNRDMRDYVARILGERFEVETAADGKEALDCILRSPPDVVLTDVMMPHLDGFALLAAIRRHARLSLTPVILLSARAGEEARIEGVEAGADDYLVKPFSARELLARVSTHVQLSQLRRRSAVSERRLREQAESERTRWRALLMQAPALIAVLRGPEHVFELVNPPYCQFIGRRPEELIGKAVVE
ncbi:MAG: response regulator, partial [Acidobacteriota bacterium]|nr:response regulator [Acidobacteriota bacterium]